MVIPKKKGSSHTHTQWVRYVHNQNQNLSKSFCIPTILVRLLISTCSLACLLYDASPIRFGEQTIRRQKKDGKSNMLNGKVKKKKKIQIYTKFSKLYFVKVVDGPSLKGKYQYRLGGGGRANVRCRQRSSMMDKKGRGVSTERGRRINAMTGFWRIYIYNE